MRKKITDRIAAEIKPALDEWHKQLDVIGKDIEKINKQSFAQQAKSSGIARKEYDRTAQAVKNLSTQTRMLDKTEESLRKARRARNELQREARKQEKETGEVAKKTADKLVDAVNRVKLIEADRLARRKAVADAERAIAEQKIKDEKKYTEAVEKETARRIKAHEDEQTKLRKLIHDAERDAERRIDAEYRQNVQLAKLDQQRTAAARREHEKRQRENEKATRAAIREHEKRRKAEERENRRKVRQQSRDTLYNDIADYGRKLGYLQTAATGPAGIAVLAAGIGDLIAVASALSGVLGTLPGILAAAGGAMGTFSVATYGVQDAMSALLDGDLDAFAESLAKLSPNAQQAMLSLQSLWPEFTAAQAAVQDAFFQGFNEKLYDLANVYLPMAREGMVELAGVFNQFVGIGIDTLIDPEVATQIQNVVDNIVAGFQALQPAVEPLIQTFVTLTEVGSSFLPQLSGIIVDLTTRFADFIAEAAQTGELQEWIQRGIDAVLELIPLVEDLVSTFIELGPMGAEMLPNIIKAFQTLIDMMPAAIAALDGTFIGPAIQALAELHDMFGNVHKAFAAIGNVGIWVYNTVSSTLGDLSSKLATLYQPLRAIGKLIGVTLPERIDFQLPALSYMPLSPPPATPSLPGAHTSLGPWNQRFDRPNTSNRTGGYQFPGTLPVPAPPVKGGGSGGKDKEPSDAEKKKAIENDPKFDPKNFVVDPFGDIGGVQNQPGWPGRPDLNVNVQNFPPGFAASTSGIPAAALAGIGNMPSVDGEHRQITETLQIAQLFGLGTKGPGIDFSGNYTHPKDGLNHPKGQAGDFSDGTPSLSNNKLAFANFMAENFSPYLTELIYGDPSFKGPFQYSQGLLDQHMNHVHVGIKDEMAPAFEAALAAMGAGGGAGGAGSPVPLSLQDNLYAANSAPIVDPTTGQLGYMQTDNQAVQNAMQSVKQAADDLAKSSRELAIATEERKQNLIDEQDLLDKKNKYEDDKARLERERQDYAEAKRGKWKDIDTPGSSGGSQRSKKWSLQDEPWGSPKRILGGILQGLGANGDSIEALLGNGIMGTAGNVAGSLGGVLGNVASDVITKASSVELPGPMGYAGVPTAPSTDLHQLVHEQSPMAWAQAAGFDVPDYSRQGGGDSAQNLTVNGGPPNDAMGRIYSDTAALIDRTFTNLDAAEKARHDQVMTVLNAVKERVGADLIGPAVGEGTAQAMESSGAALGTEMGQAAGPIIAQAVASAVAGSGGGGADNAGAGIVTTGVSAITSVVGAVAGFASGGPVTGGVSGKDSVPAMLMPKEWVLNTRDVAMLGGPAGVQSFLSAMHRKGGIQHFATGGGVNVNKTVGAEFFGVSQIPILGTIINLLVSVLLTVIGVEIEARDTLNEISSEFRDFRGDFKAFDSYGRMMNDTSALIDRTGSSEQAAADERIRILKIVLQALIKYIVDNVIVPAAKAVGNALLQAAGSALSGGLGAAFPGGEIVGQAASGIITSAGSAAIDIWSVILSDLGLAASEVLMDGIGEVLQSYLPGATNALFGGKIFASIFDPLTTAVNGITGTIGTLLGALFGGLGTVIPGKTFDSGGLAHGTGLMPKATIAPERVLSPRETMLFDDMVAALKGGASMASSKSVIVHAPFTVTGSEKGGRQVHDRLLSLMS